jgi:hypothetical protein
MLQEDLQTTPHSYESAALILAGESHGDNNSKASQAKIKSPPRDQLEESARPSCDLKSPRGCLQ